jgi:hypothetical protein
VLRVVSPLGDPTGECVDLSGRELLARIGRRHALGCVGGCDPLDNRTPCRLAGDDRPGLNRKLADVQTEIRFAMGRIRAVAGEAFVRQDRPDVAVEVDRLGGERKSGPGDEQKESRDDSRRG